MQTCAAADREMLFSVTVEHEYRPRLCIKTIDLQFKSAGDALSMLHPSSSTPLQRSPVSLRTSIAGSCELTRSVPIGPDRECRRWRSLERERAAFDKVADEQANGGHGERAAFDRR
ncbi:MAG: hypothetical protein JWO36_6198 [Myxococcales bacterium]|nr:hypothetical protein [Myxococcales bacterium]